MATNGNSNGSGSGRRLKGDAPEFVPRHQEHVLYEMQPSYPPSPPQYYVPSTYGQYNGYQFNGPSSYQPMPGFYPGPVDGAYLPMLPPQGQYYPHQAAPWPAANGEPVHSLDPFLPQMKMVEDARIAENAQSYHENYNAQSYHEGFNAPNQTAPPQNNRRKKGKKGKKSKKGKKAATNGGVEERNGERVEHRA